MSDGTFQKVEKSEKQMYGPRGLLVCGWPLEERERVFMLLEQAGINEIPVVFVSDEDGDKSLQEILGLPDRHGMMDPSTFRRAGVMSGFTEKELHGLLGVYRQSGLPQQLWATLTPVSETWSIRDLLEELAREAEAMKKKVPKVS
jgi:hypothetical protein